LDRPDIPKTVGRWYLMAGSTGAGKTTAARELAERVGGVRFSIDEWMNALYWMDCPEKNDLGWALERVARCKAQIAVVAEQLGRVGVFVGAGFGVYDAGAEARLDVDAEVRWARVCERNRGEDGTFSFVVTREMFELMEARWEAVRVEELGEFGAESPRG